MILKNNYIDVYVTAVPEVSNEVAFKDTNPPGPSFLFNHMKSSIIQTIMFLFPTNGTSWHS